LEDLIREEFTPLFTHISEYTFKSDPEYDPEEMYAFKLERIENAMLKVIKIMI
jgi:hypothetical protein